MKKMTTQPTSSDPQIIPIIVALFILSFGDGQDSSPVCIFLCCQRKERLPWEAIGGAGSMDNGMSEIYTHAGRLKLLTLSSL